jgi:hypothetical protein
VDEVQRRALFGRGPAQVLLLGCRDRCVAERVAVGPSSWNRAEQADDLGSGWRRSAASDLGDEPGAGSVRAQRHVRADASPLQREAEVEQGGTAGDAKLLVLGVDDRQPTRRIDVQRNGLRCQREGPRLGVVD